MPERGTIDGVLCQARGSKYGEAIYFCRLGRRHYVGSVEHIESLGKKWPDDVLQVDAGVLDAFSIGGHVPLAGSDLNPLKIRSSVTMREHLASKFTGHGLELGAGGAPFPAPLNCRVLFGDRFGYSHLLASAYAGQTAENIVPPDVITDFCTLDGVADESQDFIIGCHVIEHTRDPIGAIAASWRKLKRGGYLLLIVPNRDRTFDRARPLTPLAHLIDDHERPSSERDFQHFQEFYTLAFETPAHAIAEVAEREFNSGGDIHYHVWTHDSFMEMVGHIDRHLTGWSEIVSYDSLPDLVHDIEFYVRLRK